MIDAQRARWRAYESNWLIPLGLIAILATAVLLIRYSPFVIALLAIGIIAGLSILRWPWVGLALLVASVPAQEFVALHSGGATITATQIIFPIAIAGYLIALLIRREPLKLHLALVPFGLMIVMQLLSSVDAVSGTSSIVDIGRWSVAFIALLLAIQFLSDGPERRILAFIGIFAAGGVFEATTGVTQSILALGPESFVINGGLSRAFGTFGKPNTYAAYLVMVFFPVVFTGLYFLGRMPHDLGKYRKIRLHGYSVSHQARTRLFACVAVALVLLASGAIILSGIVASLSRGAWLGFAVATFVTALLWNRITRYLALLAIPIALLIVVVGQAGLVPERISDRFSTDSTQFRLFDAGGIPITDENFAAVERMAHWQAGWIMFESEPGLGIGAGNFNTRYGDFYVREEFRISRGHAHNYYIHALAETGVAGLVAYLTLTLGFIFLGIRPILGMPGGLMRAVALGALGSTVAISVHSFFENLHVLNLGIQLSCIWGLIIAANLHWRRVQAAGDGQSGW